MIYVSDVLELGECPHGYKPVEDQGHTRVDCEMCAARLAMIYPDMTAGDPNDERLLTPAVKHVQEEAHRQFEVDRDAFMKAQYQAFLEWQAQQGARSSKSKAK